MAKNFLGFEDNSWDGRIVHKAEFPSIEGAVKGLTGYALPFIDASRGAGSLLNNAVVFAEGIARRLPDDGFPDATNSLAPAQPVSEDRIRELIEMYGAKKRQSAAQGKSFYPSQE
jgi:hypothetical protein